MVQPPATGAADESAEALEALEAAAADSDALEAAGADSDAAEEVVELDDPDEAEDALVELPAHPANATHAAIAPTSANTKSFFTMDPFLLCPCRIRSCNALINHSRTHN